MKYLHWFKGFIFIALTCTLSAEGSTVEQSSISGGQSVQLLPGTRISANGFTYSSSDGKSIQLLPGTRISAGGFIYAPAESNIKEGKQHKKEIRLVTVEELKTIEEQASLSVAYTLFSPFPARTKGHLHAGDAEQGSFTTSANVLSGVAPEQQRKAAVESRLLPQVTRNPILTGYIFSAVAYATRSEIMMVLRL